MYSPKKIDPNVDMIHEFLEDVYTNQPQDQIAETYRFHANIKSATTQKFSLQIKTLRIDENHL